MEAVSPSTPSTPSNPISLPNVPPAAAPQRQRPRRNRALGLIPSSPVSATTNHTSTPSANSDNGTTPNPSRTGVPTPRASPGIVNFLSNVLNNIGISSSQKMAPVKKKQPIDSATKNLFSDFNGSPTVRKGPMNVEREIPKESPRRNEYGEATRGVVRNLEDQTAMKEQPPAPAMNNRKRNNMGESSRGSSSRTFNASPRRLENAFDSPTKDRRVRPKYGSGSKRPIYTFTDSKGKERKYVYKAAFEKAVARDANAQEGGVGILKQIQKQASQLFLGKQNNNAKLANPRTPTKSTLPMYSTSTAQTAPGAPIKSRNNDPVQPSTPIKPINLTRSPPVSRSRDKPSNMINAPIKPAAPARQPYTPVKPRSYNAKGPNTPLQATVKARSASANARSNNALPTPRRLERNRVADKMWNNGNSIMGPK